MLMFIRGNTQTDGKGQAFIATGNPVNGNMGAEVSSVQQKFRESFSGVLLDPNNWDVLQTGPGQSIAVSGGALALTFGTTINAETILLSKVTCSIPSRLLFSLMLSSKIINTDLAVEFVSVGADGLPDGRNLAGFHTNVPTGSMANASVAQNYYQVQASGGTPLDSPLAAFLTTAAQSLREIEMFSDETWFHDRAIDSTAGRTNSYVRHQSIPDPNAIYKIRIRARNGSVAPASSIVATILFVNLIDYLELTAEITAGRGGSSAGQSIPVSVIAGTLPAVSSVVTVTTPQTTVANVDSVANLGAGANFTGTARDAGAVQTLSGMRVTVSHLAGLVPGQLAFEQSTDNATWRETARIPIPSDGLYHTFDFAQVTRYARLRFYNPGATAQTAFFLGSISHKNPVPMDSDRSLSFQHTVTPLGSAGTFVGATLDLGPDHRFDVHRASIFADQAGTAYLEQSRDGTNWRKTQTTAIVANTPVIVSDPIVARYVRVSYLNGATIQTVYEHQSALIPA